MKKIRLAILLLTISCLLFSCTSKKNKIINVEKDTNVSKEEVVTEQNKEEIKAFSMVPIKRSISKQFIYEFPVIIDLDKVRNYTYSISDLSEEEKQFYDKYVGSYISKGVLSNLSYYLSEVYVKNIQNGIVFWGLCKSYEGISYDSEDKQFYETDTFSTMPIESISDFELNRFPYYEQHGYKRITDCKIVEDLIAEKKAKMNRPQLTELQEENVRNLLTDFFTVLCKKDFDEIPENFFVTINDRN